MLPENVEFSLETQLHTLLHFRKADTEWMERIIAGSEHTPEEAYELMQKPGSKFFPDFAHNPLHLWENLQQFQNHITEVKEQGGQKQAFLFRIPKTQHPEGVGTSGIIKLSSLTVEEKNNLTSTMRNGLKVFSVSISRPIPTWQVNMILQTSGTHHKVITIFPGIYAPPLPDPRWHSAKQINEFSDFWQGHVFVS